MASAFAFGAGMLPLRDHLSVATAALVLVIPVVAGAVIGGFGAGAASVVAGFVVYDLGFVPPYYHFTVSSSNKWAALAVYVIVMLLVARVVDVLERTRSEALRGHEVIRQVSAVSELLVGDQPVADLLRTIVVTAQAVFDVPGVSLLELEGGDLVVVASAGKALSDEELRNLQPRSGVPIRVGATSAPTGALRTVALATADRPIGILAMWGSPALERDDAVLTTFANDAALALERARLREEALRSKLLEEAERFRHGLLGAVSHDLRTPLASIKVASSTLTANSASLSHDDAAELYDLIDLETDRLTRLVTNLLDMTRIEAGVLTLRRTLVSVGDLVDDARRSIEPSLGSLCVDVATLEATDEIVDVDRVLIGQVLVNLLDNAVRFSPSKGVINIGAIRRGDLVHLSVADQGPGVTPDNRETIFDRFTQLDTGGRAGLGLTIATTFVEVHGEHLWYEEAPDGGARFVLSLHLASTEAGL